MAPLRRSDPVSLRRWAGRLVMAAGLLSVAASGVWGRPGAAAPYARPDAETIRKAAREILQSPRFAEKRTFAEWLREWLGDWRLPPWGEGGLVVHVLFWALLVASGVVVLAVLVHFILSVAAAYRGPGGIDAGSQDVPHFRDLRARSYDELRQLMTSLGNEGDYRRAIGVMMVALLRWLEAAGMLGFDDGKTNGDYVREYPPTAGGGGKFREFVHAFDGRIYAGAPCRRSDYEEMIRMFETVQAHVRPKP